MIRIDGGHGEGGGQILRTSIALSGVTGEPVEVVNIRSKRSNPGLRPQHLKAIESAARLCEAETEGLSVSSQHVTFKPSGIKTGKINIDIGTAGSITLLSQALLPIALNAGGEVSLQIRGGTDVKWSPPTDYFQHVFLWFLEKIGCRIESWIERRGFYPRGGGQINLRVKPWRDKEEIDFTEKGKFQGIQAYSLASMDLKKPAVADRQVKGFLREVSSHWEVKENTRNYVKTQSTGSVLTSIAEYGHSRLGASTLGERGLKSEMVGSKTAEKLLKEMDSKAPLDKYMGDQMIPYLAMTSGRAKTTQVTGHCETNAWAARQFGFDVQIRKNTITSR